MFSSEQLYAQYTLFFISPSEEIENQANIYWEALPKDSADRFMGTGHIVKVTHQSDGTPVFSQSISQKSESELPLFNGKRHNLLTLNQSTLVPGEAYRVNVEACGANDGAIFCSRTNPSNPNEVPLFIEKR